MQSAKIVISLGLLFIILHDSVNGGKKYSEDVNAPINEIEEPFRIMKLNQLWSKAKLRLNSKRLADIYADLKVQDKKEGELKKLKLENLDEDGLKAAQVEEKFMEIVVKYGLNNHYQFKHKDVDVDNSLGKKRPQELKDPKLLKLWSQASASGFTENELNTLREELSHHQLKLDEYDFLKEEVNNFQENELNTLREELSHHQLKLDEYDFLKEEVNNFQDADLNSIEESDYFDPKKMKFKEKDLKSKHKDLKSNYQRLEELLEDPNMASADFSDIRVYELWSMAKKANMSEEEMLSLKEELKHFQHRLMKHEYFKEQVSLSEKSLRGQVKDGMYPDKHEELEKKAKDYEYKVKKIHNDLRTRIEDALQRHTEL